MALDYIELLITSGWFFKSNTQLWYVCNSVGSANSVPLATFSEMRIETVAWALALMANESCVPEWSPSHTWSWDLKTRVVAVKALAYQKGDSMLSLEGESLASEASGARVCIFASKAQAAL